MSFLGYCFTFAETHRRMKNTLSRRVFVPKENAILLKVNLRTFKIETGRRFSEYREVIGPCNPDSSLEIPSPLALRSST